MTRKARYVVLSGDAYLVSLPKALAGRGVDGGAFTLDLAKARRFTHYATARAAAAQVHNGRWERLP